VVSFHPKITDENISVIVDKIFIFSRKKRHLTPWRDSISRPIAPVSSMLGVGNTRACHQDMCTKLLYLQALKSIYIYKLKSECHKALSSIYGRSWFTKSTPGPLPTLRVVERRRCRHARQIQTTSKTNLDSKGR
jgi:hypothetical protein